MTQIVHLDFELAGVLDLGDVGVDVWTKDPNTVPILMGFAIDDYGPTAIDFRHEMQGPYYRQAVNALVGLVEHGAEIHAWNAPFEFAVWNNICVPRYAFPPLPVERFHCTMAAAACAGLPMALSDAAEAVGAPFTKDKVGQALMKRMARPRRFDGKTPVWWHREDPDKLQRLIKYNRADVETERAVHQRIPAMTPREREIWLADQRMNARGLPVDGELLTALHVITLQELLRLNAEIRRVTQGAVEGSSQNARLLDWVRERGYPHASLAKRTLADFIASGTFAILKPAVREVLTLRAEAAKTSTAKLVAIRNYAQADGRARGLTQYGGAVRTLRWAGRGPQIQNFPKPVIKHVGPAIAEILGGMDADGLRILFGRPLDVVSSCLRGVFKAPEGFRFVVCDYHAIEAIVLAWLANFEPLLDVFRNHEDVYAFTARGVGSNDRQLGKVLRLACGYGMGAAKFQDTAATYNLTLTAHEAQDAVQAFRESNSPIVNLWGACEEAAKRAIANPDGTFLWRHKLAFTMARRQGRLAGALLMMLPSERYLVYRNARLEKNRIVFWGVHQLTRQWGELDTYGGKLVENATQAIARDLLAEAIVDFDREFPGALLTTVHDEIVAMVRTEDAPRLLERMKTIMGAAPSWAAGMPLSAAGGILERYGKL